MKKSNEKKTNENTNERIIGKDQWKRSMDKISGKNQWKRSMEKINGSDQWTRSMDQIMGKNSMGKIIDKIIVTAMKDYGHHHGHHHGHQHEHHHGHHYEHYHGLHHGHHHGLHNGHYHVQMVSDGYNETITVTEKDDMVGTFSPFNWTNMSALIDTALCTVKTFKYQSEVDI